MNLLKFIRRPGEPQSAEERVQLIMEWDCARERVKRLGMTELNHVETQQVLHSMVKYLEKKETKHLDTESSK